MKRIAGFGFALLLFLTPISVFAEQKDIIKLPGSTQKYTIYDKDGNSVTVTFNHEKDKIRLVITPPNSDELETIEIPKDDTGNDDENNQDDKNDKDDDKNRDKNSDEDKDNERRSSKDRERDPSQSGDNHIHVPVNYTDINNHWAKQDILAFSNAGLIQGYPDGTFRPNNPISRAEFAALLERVLEKVGVKKEGEQPPSRFKDVPPSSWYYLSVNWLENRGNIPHDKYPNGLLHPNEPILREEMALWLAHEVSSDKPMPMFKDMAQIRFQEEVRNVTGAGLLLGYPDSTFRPKGQTTRAEAVTILMRFMRSSGLAE
ncbi:S-layer homology domain-containing protein [Brevibacillus marinus]|uniref:S-layer homology domain-containing protein n=1 Tax=Brevibacillus marinus TaxID=2496837 RepID=UPI0013DEFFD1|nr:S-layer homology domain-containing protein [Brevibacillus marinus]